MTEPVVILIEPDQMHLLGFIPTFLDLDDPRPAAEQFNERYVYGGWRPQDGFITEGRSFVLKYPEDPLLFPIAAIPFRDEWVLIYPHGYVAIFQEDGAFEACRMD